MGAQVNIIKIARTRRLSDDEKFFLLDFFQKINNNNIFLGEKETHFYGSLASYDIIFIYDS